MKNRKREVKMDGIDSGSATNTMQDTVSAIEEALYPSDVKDESMDSSADADTDDAQIELPDGEDAKATETDSDDDVVDLDEELSLASYLGVDESRIFVDESGNTMLNAIIDGQTKPVPLSELTKSFQLQGHVNNQSIALQNQRKDFEAQSQAASAQVSDKLVQLAGMSSLLEEQLLGEYDAIDWDRLRSENPSEWSALRQDYAERAQSVQAAQKQIADDYANIKYQSDQKNNIARRQHLGNQANMVMQDNPTWADPAVKAAAQNEMKAFMRTVGYSDMEISQVTDHRQVKIIQDAMAYRNGTAKAAEKQVKAVPKFKRAGASKAQTAAAANARSVKAKRAAVKSSGSVKDAANLLLDRM